MKRIAVLLILLAACREEAATAPPAPLALTDEAVGHYCRMLLVNHEGPQGQAHLAGQAEPIWFAQVRDGLAYVKSPEEEAAILALYVNDVAAASGWGEMGRDNWIDAQRAFYVIGSDARGGMGAPEIVPFAAREAAQAFAQARGGEVVAFAEIPAEAVLAPIEGAMSMGGHE